MGTPHQNQAVVECPDDHHTQQRPDDRAGTSAQAAATEEGCADRIELQPLAARGRLAGVGARGQDDGGQSAREAGAHVHAKPVARDVDAGEDGGFDVAADRSDVSGGAGGDRVALYAPVASSIVSSKPAADHRENSDAAQPR